MGELNVYEDSALDQSPLAWLQQELFAPAIPTFKGYQSRAGFIGLSATGGSVLCPNKTCAETGARLCDGLEGKCAGFSFFQPADCKPVCAVQWHGGNITQQASFCDPATCKETGGARWNLCECASSSVWFVWLPADGKALHGTDRKLVLHE